MFTSISSSASSSRYPSDGELLYATDFGVVMDGAYDNSDELIAMRDYMLTKPQTLFTVHFEAGTCVYTNNRWIFNVNKLIIDAYGVNFQCIIDNAWNSNSIPLNTYDPFDDRGDVIRTAPSDNWVLGDLFDSVSSGVYTISTTTEGDAANYSAGERVLIQGYDHQFSGYPMNPRYFEYKTINSVGTGIITFTEPLEFSYDSRWPDTDWGFGDYGKPRVLSLKRPNYIHPDHLEIKGATFLANPNDSSFEELITPALELIYTDVTAGKIPVTCSKNVTLNNCICVSGPLEVDKVLSSVTINNGSMYKGTWHALGGGTGAREIILNGVNVYGSINLMPRSLTITGCNLVSNNDEDNGVVQILGGWPVTYLNVSDCTFTNNAPATLVRAIDDGISKTFVATSVIGTTIYIPFDATGKAIAGWLDYGHRVYDNAESLIGTVTAIYYDDVSNIVIEGTWASVIEGDTYRFHAVENPYDGGGNTIIGNQVSMWRHPEWQ